MWDLKSNSLDLIPGSIANQVCDLEEVFNHTKPQRPNFQNCDSKGTYYFRWLGRLNKLKLVSTLPGTKYDLNEY